jgi:hypothetical protein
MVRLRQYQTIPYHWSIQKTNHMNLWSATLCLTCKTPLEAWPITKRSFLSLVNFLAVTFSISFPTLVATTHGHNHPLRLGHDGHMAVCQSSKKGCSVTKMSQTSRGSTVKNISRRFWE